MRIVPKPKKRNRSIEELKNLLVINLRQLIFVFIAFFIMVAVSGFFVVRMTGKEISRNAEEVLATAEAHIYSQLREVEITALNLAVSIQNLLDLGADMDEVSVYLKQVNADLLEEDENATGLIFMGGLIEGQFQVGMDWTPDQSYTPTERPWYSAALKANGSVTFIGPYIDARTGERIVSFAKLMRGVSGEEYGVLFVDMEMKGIVDYVSKLRLSHGGYGVIVAPDGTFVAHPNPEFIGRSLSELGGEYEKLAQRIATSEENISNVQFNSDEGKRQIVTFLQRMGTGWYIGMVTPSASYYRDMYYMIGILSALGVLMALVLCYLLLRLSMEKAQSEAENLSKTTFLAKMSHEIRTPMNSILGMVELILRKDISRDVYEYASIIHQAGENLLAIINDILDFSKIEAGQLSIAFEPYHLGSLLNDVINVIRIRLIEKPVSFFVKANSRMPSALIGDEVHVRQVLMNLLSNAAKYTHSGHILLKLDYKTLEDGRVRLAFTVEDSGVGIKKEDLERLFEDFTRVEDSRNRKVEGTGLGLSIVQNLCIAMEGDISATSEYGKGSVFRATVVQTPDGTGTSVLASVSDPEQKRVLVFERRPAHLDVLTHALSDLGVDTVCAADKEAFERGLESRLYHYAFVTSEDVLNSMFVVGKSKSPTLLVNMIEMGEVSVYKEIDSITMPIFCVGVANILNGIRDTWHFERRRGARFAAPDARVLIVDDISTNLRVSKELMTIYRMNIHTCLSGEEAIEMVRMNCYDIVFMDHMMPGMDGIEATAAIREMSTEDDYYRDLPIIALTANAIAGQREVFLQGGMNDFLAKPIELQKLNALLRRWIPEDKQIQTNPQEEDSENDAEEYPMFFEIEGVSIETGLRNSGGSMPAYMDILEDFCRDASERSDRIRTCAASGDTTLYMTMVHALKGASRSIGAAEFGDFAAKLEEAARNEDMETIRAKTDDFLAALELLIEAIRYATDATNAESDDEDDADAEVDFKRDADKLRAALTDMDIRTVNELLMEFTTRTTSPKTKKVMANIEQHILLFEYDEAIRELDAFDKG